VRENVASNHAAPVLRFHSILDFRDTENDPEGAEEFVALIRALRKEVSRTIAL
jgi:hypothetical protein